MIEVILWLAVPVAFAAIVAFCSITLARLGGTLGQVTATIVVVALVGIAGHMLWAIARGAWPSVVPHLLILATLPIVFGQAAAIVRAADRPSRTGSTTGSKASR